MYTTRCRISCNAFRPTVFITDRDQSPSMHRLEGQKSRSAVKRLKTRLSRNRRNASRAMSQSLLLEWSQFRPNTSGLELARVGRPTETSCVADHQVPERVFHHAYGFLSMAQPLGRTFRSWYMEDKLDISRTPRRFGAHRLVAQPLHRRIAQAVGRERPVEAYVYC
jgi:hypothetical protein